MLDSSMVVLFVSLTVEVKTDTTKGAGRRNASNFISKKEMQAITIGLEKVEQELATSERRFFFSFQKLKEFLADAQAEGRSLTLLYSSAGKSADSLAHYFGEDLVRCPFEQGILLIRFITRQHTSAERLKLLLSWVTFSAKDIEFSEWKGDILTVAVTEKDLSKDSDSKFDNAVLKKLDSQLRQWRKISRGKLGNQWFSSSRGRVSRGGIQEESNLITAAAIASDVLVEEVSKIASTYSDVSTDMILDVEKCKGLKMGSYLGVAAASANPPHFIHLCYKPTDGNVKRKLALVGKGLTFDSKELMKFYMGGSVAVFGAAKAFSQIKPPGVEVHFIVAAHENMISGKGMRPGDIVTACNVKTIEVNNTDAEGRFTLADALVYACNQGVNKIIDLEALTGACVVALGPSIAGIFLPSDELAKEVTVASESSLPITRRFSFLAVQWMHIDMAGSVWNDNKCAAPGSESPPWWGVGPQELIILKTSPPAHICFSKPGPIIIPEAPLLEMGITEVPQPLCGMGVGLSWTRSTSLVC
ncbi:Leucine aminopeptidase 2, chloroplastic [Dichanthelium oligosanthes]|uniref:Leucine aminopeptidase 2, chloroplastic n=1 Tax=Dichanthelium oligosanthes TaxID=888268 RepID=A0A1E5UJC7_9POAL|nr:Leucine aminopeptidase 2, chloroplastic [Dichanthelium oligosanthes]